MPNFWEHLRWGGETKFTDLQGAEGSDMAIYVSHPPPSAGADFPAIRQPKRP